MWDLRENKNIQFKIKKIFGLPKSSLKMVVCNGKIVALLLTSKTLQNDDNVYCMITVLDIQLFIWITTG